MISRAQREGYKNKFLVFQFCCDEVPEELTHGIVLALLAESLLILGHLRRVRHAGADHASDGSELGLLCHLRFGVRVVLEVTFAASGATATAVTPVAGDSNEFFYFAKNLA